MYMYQNLSQNPRIHVHVSEPFPEPQNTCTCIRTFPRTPEYMYMYQNLSQNPRIHVHVSEPFPEPQNACTIVHVLKSHFPSFFTPRVLELKHVTTQCTDNLQHSIGVSGYQSSLLRLGLTQGSRSHGN